MNKQAFNISNPIYNTFVRRHIEPDKDEYYNTCYQTFR
jgi:hypothetical protein